VQTVERAQELADQELVVEHHKKPRWFALVAGVLVIVVVVALVAYAIASSQTSTKTVVKTVTAPAPGGVAPAFDDRGFSQLDNGHQAEEKQFDLPLDAATRAVLSRQLLLAREAAMKYPTVADAVAAGYHRAGPFAPGLGAHYLNYSDYGATMMPNGKIDDNAALHPAMLIYDGTHPDSRIAGLMYYSMDPRLPQGFAGPNDVWHYHTDVCIVASGGNIDTPYGADTTVTKAMCDAVHGSLMAKTQWMLHAWVVPGYDSPEGVFSHLNEEITCRDGTYHTIPLESIGNRASVCADGGE
jgi:hypothetical protein